MKVANGSITWKSDDGENGTLGFEMPMEVLSKILCDIIDWKNRWRCSFAEAEEYFKKAQIKPLSEPPQDIGK